VVPGGRTGVAVHHPLGGPGPLLAGLSVWIFGDLPLGTACGPSYMVESWTRELGRLGARARLFTPSGSWRRWSRTPQSVTFRTLRHVGFSGDYHARFSTLAELRRARGELPDVILVTTPGRVGVLGITVAARHEVPLVLVASTEITGAMAHYNALRLFLSGGCLPLVLLTVAPKVRAALRTWRGRPVRIPGRGAGIATRCSDAVQVQARELVLLSRKSLTTLVGDGDRPPAVVIPAGIDRLPPAPAPPELRWRAGALRVLYVGRLMPEKSLPLLVEALALSAGMGCDVHLVMVGGGRLGPELTAAAERLGVADRFTILGPYERSSLQGVYASADVFAFASMVETQAFVLNEAAHEGLPLLVSDPDINPVVRDGHSALVVPHRPQAYADAFQRLQDRDLRARLGLGARSLALQVREGTQTARLAEVLRRAALGISRPAKAGSLR
jgi:glycosyltransferase involved in cell wall biosynthesis